MISLQACIGYLLINKYLGQFIHPDGREQADHMAVFKHKIQTQSECKTNKTGDCESIYSRSHGLSCAKVKFTHDSLKQKHASSKLAQWGNHC